MNKVGPLIQEDGPCDYSFPCSEYHERCQSSYDKMKDENEDLRVLLSQHSTHWRAVAAALGGISCGGVDVPVTDPTGTAGSIIAGIHRRPTREAERQAEVERLTRELVAEREALVLTLDLVQDSFGNGMMRASGIAECLPIGTGLQGKSIAEAIRAEVALCEPARRWVLHILGPDDVIDQPDELTALRSANKHNKAFAKLMADDPSPNDPYCVALAESV